VRPRIVAPPYTAEVDARRPADLPRQGRSFRVRPGTKPRARGCERAPGERPMASAVQQLLTEQEYLALERAASTKSEFLAGQMFAMAGGKRSHNLIASNVIIALGTQLTDRHCQVYPSDMRVKIAATGLYTYPDISVVCGEEQFEDNEQDVLLNPTLIVE